MKHESRHHPILRTEVLTSDGRAEPVSLRVYCKRRGGTVPIAECAACEKVVRVNLSAEVHLTGVECDDSSEVAAPEEAESEPAGALISGTVACVAEDAMANEAIECLIRLGKEEAPVIDREGHYLGILRGSGLIDRANADTALNALTRAAAVYENDTVYEAVVRMAKSRQREIIVLSSERKVVGVLRSVDAIRWLTNARKSAG